MTIQNKKSTDWVLIPPTILADEKLTAMEKLVLGRIMGRITENGCCEDTNEYLAKGLSTTKGNVANIISKLNTSKWILVDVIRNPETREIIFRKIKMNTPVEEVSNFEPTNTSNIPTPIHPTMNTPIHSGVNTPIHPEVNTYSPRGDSNSIYINTTIDNKNIKKEVVDEIPKTIGDELDNIDFSVEKPIASPVTESEASQASQAPVGMPVDYYNQPREARYAKIPTPEGLLSMTRGQEMWLVEKTHVDLDTIRDEAKKAYNWSMGKERKTEYLMFLKNWLLRAQKYGKLVTVVNGNEQLPPGEWQCGDGTYTVVRGTGSDRIEFTISRKEYIKMTDDEYRLKEADYKLKQGEKNANIRLGS